MRGLLVSLSPQLKVHFDALVQELLLLLDDLK